MATLTYRRDESRRFDQLDFGVVRILDTTELARRWTPWFALAAATRVPLRARNALYLARVLTGEVPLEETTWFGIVSVSSARYQVVRQARADEYLCARPDELDTWLRTSSWQELVRRCTDWSAQSPAERVVLVALLTQLGFHRYITSLLPTLRPAVDPVAQQLIYEASRAVHQLDRNSPTSFNAFAYLAEDAARPALRVLAALQLVSAHARDRGDHDTAGRWLGVAEDALPALGQEPGWLTQLVHSRYHRAAALHHLTGRHDVSGCRQHMVMALRTDDTLAGLVDGPLQTHYQRENRQLVLEAYVKLDTRTDAHTAPVDTVDSLVALDPVDPEPRHAIGELHAANARWQEAYESFIEAARSGTFRGASSASAAAQCLQRMGRHTEAEDAHQLSVELDPAAISPLTAADT